MAKSSKITPRKRLKKIAKALAVLTGVLLLVAAGLLLWLRSDSGAAFVYGRLSSALESSGLKLSAAEFKGPLPGRLLIREAVVADAEGPIAKIGRLEAEIRLRDLIRGLVNVPLLAVAEPELLRLPPLPASPEEDSSGPFVLPVDIRLGTLSIKGGRVEGQALKSLSLDNPPFTFQAEASGRLEGKKAELNFQAGLRESGGSELLSALIKLETAETAAPDQLLVQVKIQDRPQGFLSALLADPDWPGLNLDLEGEGPLNAWSGRLSLAAGNFGEFKSDLQYQGRSGKMLNDLAGNPEWSLALAAVAVPGQILPESLSRFTGSPLNLSLDGRRQGDRLDLALDLSQNESSPPLALNSRLEGLLKDGGGSFEFKSDLSGLKLSPLAEAAPLSLNLSAGFDLDGARQKLSGLQLKGQGLSLEAAASRDAESGALAGDFELKLEDGSQVWDEGLRLAGLKEEELGGNLLLSGEIDWRGLSQAASGQLKASASELRWPSESLNRLLGSSLDLELGLAGGGGQVFKLEIARAEAGELSLAGTASFKPHEVEAESALEADLKADLKNLAALLPQVSGPLALELRGQGRLNDLEARLKVSSPALHPAPGPLEGLELEASLSGLILAAEGGAAAPDLSGRLELKVAESPGGPLALGTGWSFSQSPAETRLKIDGLSGDLAGLDLAGQLEAALGSSANNLQGRLEAGVSDWSKLSALTGLAFSGAPAKFSLNLEPGQGGQEARAELDLPALKIKSGPETVADLKNSALKFRASDLFGWPDLQLNLSLGSGLAGPAAWGPGSIEAAGQGGQGLFSGQIKQLKLNGAGGQSRDGLVFEGAYELAAASSARLDKLELNLGPNGLSLKEPLNIGLAPELSLSPFSATFKPKGSLRAQADLNPGAMKIKADLKKLPYSFIRAFAGPAVPEGEIQSLTVDLAQSPSGLSGDFALQTQAAPKELKNLKPAVALNGTLSDGSSPALKIKAAIDGGPGWAAKGDLEASLPLTPATDGAFPGPDMAAPFSARLKFMGPVAPIWKILDQADRSFSGQLLIEAEAGGSLSRPVPKGSAWLDKGRFEDTMYGLLISDISLEAHSTPELPLKALLAAKDGRNGALALEAQLTDLNNPSLKAQGRMQQFSPIHRDDLIVFISGAFGAEGPINALKINSDLTMDRGEMDLKVVAMANSIPTLNITSPGEAVAAIGRAMPFDLKIKIPNQFFIRGYGLESEWKGDLSIGGSSRRPSIVGALIPVRGYFEFYAKEFQFSGGDISFNGGSIPNLNLELTYSGPSITAIIKATGTASQPQINLESRPPMPRDEILAQVLFGKSASAISRFEALQLASAVRDLTNIGSGGGLNALGTLRASLGLDVLRVGGSDSGQERRASELSGSMGQEMRGSGAGSQSQADDFAVEAGKYLSDNVYVGVEHSGVSGPAVRMEIELRPNVSFEARTSQESSRFGLGWKKDY